jgi:hypothetical protein
VIPFDTTLAAQAIQLEVYRRMEPAARVALAFAMSVDARSLVRSGIASRHPDYTGGQLDHALRRLLCGEDLFRRVWPTAPLLAPCAAPSSWASS